MLTDSCMPALARLSRLRNLNLAGTGVRNPLIGALAPHLRSLNLEGCSLLSKSALFWVGALTGLRNLHLGRCSSLSGGSLFQLRNLTRLESIVLPPNITARDVMHLSGLHRLTSLSLRRLGLIDLSWMSGMTRLVSLNLGGNLTLLSLKGIPVNAIEELVLQGCRGMTDDCIAILPHFPVLRLLELAGCDSVTDTGALTIAKGCDTLEQLSVQGCGISGVGLRALTSQLTRLQTLDIRGTRCEWDDITQLQGLRLKQFRFDPNPNHGVGDDNDDEDDHHDEDDDEF